MQKISASTFFYKRIFPVFWFGFLAIFIALFALGKMHGKDGQPAPLFALIIPIGMMVFGYFIMQKFIGDLMDEVLDGGDYLVVKHKGFEEQIPLTNIINVSYAGMTNPRRVTLTLRSPCQFGDKIAFIPARASFTDRFGFSNALVDELVKRIDAKRRA